uniref:Uncharacterized protein n=1 Tax=Picea glauca TaxID=3330 RepID=A0A101LXV5_PICGL|nr:hypothetical protein ABT39_MTgene5519 [Picea glauca]
MDSLKRVLARVWLGLIGDKMEPNGCLFLVDHCSPRVKQCFSQNILFFEPSLVI